MTEKKKVNVFLAGPIAGVPNYKENFAEAERIVRDWWRAQYYEPVRRPRFQPHH